MKRKYGAPWIVSQKSFETNALDCAKGPQPPPGSHHFYSAYDTFTGHFGAGITEELHGVSASATGSAGIGFGPGGTSQVYQYSGMCLNWVTLSS
jgi:hypothetical protein